jgi:hypothetical protein
MAGLTAEISFTDADIFIKLIDVCKMIVADDRVPVEHKQTLKDVIDKAGQRSDKNAKVFYECDGLACEECNAKSGGLCFHTSDIRHAKNFMRAHPQGAYREKILEVQQ